MNTVRNNNNAFVDIICDKWSIQSPANEAIFIISSATHKRRNIVDPIDRNVAIDRNKNTQVRNERETKIHKCVTSK